MERTELLALPYIMPSQSQKHVTHNEAIRALDALVQIAVVDDALADPPGTPAPGDRYIVPDGATGAWSGMAGTLAAFQEGAWMHYEPRAGWIAYVISGNRLRVHDGAAWSEPVAASELRNLQRVGVNATASGANRLAVAADATLLTAETADHRLVVNRGTATGTASLLFQSEYSGRAEMGLAGDDAFSVKVSADGAAWFETLRLDASGAVRLRPLASVDLPAADAAGTGALALVTDGPDGATLAVSNGLEWRPVALGAPL